MTTHNVHGLKKKAQSGFSLIELMISMVILAVGLSALLVLFLNAAQVDSRNTKDTSATLLAKMVVEQISAQDVNAPISITMTDCAGTSWTINGVDTAASTGTGTGANLVASASSPYYGSIDQTQAYSSIPAGYAMQYTDCDTNGHQTTYDVRWNVMTEPGGSTRLITASARQLNSPATELGNLRFAVPVTVRGIGALK